jgi:hypothetical protein
MSRLNRIARGVTLCASLGIVAAMATALPLKPAAAQNNDWNSGQWHHDGYGHQNSDRNWYRGGYNNRGYYRAPTYYYVSPPTYYYQPAPSYYQPRPYYSQPGINLNVVIP